MSGVSHSTLIVFPSAATKLDDQQPTTELRGEADQSQRAPA